MDLNAAAQGAATDRRRYLQLLVLVMVAGVIYPLVYLRQNFEVSMLEVFALTATELGECYSLLGVLFFVSYLPSGWLADRLSPRLLLTVSLAATALLGLWYATLPPLWALRWIYAGWGITTGLTFWGALIKQTNLLAGTSQQGRFFGILEGGRGVVEALLASVVVAWFAWALTGLEVSTARALQQVIVVYVLVLLIMVPLTWWCLAADEPSPQPDDTLPQIRMRDDLMLVVGNPAVWLAAVCIHCGYALFYASYSFAGYLQTELGFSAIVAGWITVGRMWMRPIGGVLAGWVGDRWRVDRVLTGSLLAAAAGLVGMIFLPAGGRAGLALAVVLSVSVLTFAVRGIYWSTLEQCAVPPRARGLAIGFISLLAYLPDVWAPLLNGYLIDTYPGRLGFALFYGAVAGLGLVGALAGYGLCKLNDRQLH